MSLDSNVRLHVGHRFSLVVLAIASLSCIPAASSSQAKAEVGQAEPAPEASPSAALPAAETAEAWRCLVETKADSPLEVQPGPDPRCPADPGHHALNRGSVVFEAANVEVAVEVAETEEDQARGLMYRTHLGDEEGMLFPLARRMVHTFWMENTCIPLDLLFIDTDGFVVGIVENASPMDRGDHFVPCPSQFVLEVNAGWCRRHGITAGMVATINR